MKRRLFNAGAVMSLLVCLTVIVLWLRSYWRNDEVRLDLTAGSPEPYTRYVELRIGKGAFVASWGKIERRDIGEVRANLGGPREYQLLNSTPMPLPPTGLVFRRLHDGMVPGKGAEQALGFGWVPPRTFTLPQPVLFPYVAFGRETRATAVAPAWFIAAAFAWLPIWCAARLVRNRRRASDTSCPACGYDLRGTPSGRSGGGSECPECGAVSAPGKGREAKP